MLVPLLSIQDESSDGMFVLYLLIHDDVKRDSFVFEIGDKRVVVRQSDALLLSKVIIDQVEKSQEALINRIADMIVRNKDDSEEWKSFG